MKDLFGLKRVLAFIRDAWTILGIALLMLVVVEAGFSAAFSVRRLWHAPNPNFRAEADTYRDRAQSAEYYRELDAFEQGRTARWRPFAYWRRVPYSGKHVNITSDGLRRTMNSPVGSGRPLKVFMFGGSTMWGLGAADDSTIPSLVAKGCAHRGINCDVVNFGQYAYVSTQSVIELMLQLQKGSLPDVVIFYDGVNDTFGAFQLGVPGFPYEESRRELEFNLTLRREIRLLAFQNFIKDLATIRVASGVLKRFGFQRDAVRSIPLEYEPPIADRHALARAVVDTYFGNLRAVQALSRAYKFELLSYWQPVIYLKEHLTDYEEQSVKRDFYYPGMKEFYLETYAYLREHAAAMKAEMAFDDLSSIFAKVRAPIYVDYDHMGEEGNRLIAERMTDDLVRVASPGRDAVSPARDVSGPRGVVRTAGLNR